MLAAELVGELAVPIYRTGFQNILRGLLSDTAEPEDGSRLKTEHRVSKATAAPRE